MHIKTLSNMLTAYIFPPSNFGELSFYSHFYILKLILIVLLYFWKIHTKNYLERT